MENKDKKLVILVNWLWKITLSFFSIKKNCIKLLEPFLKFVLLEPSQSQQFLQIRTNLQRTLLQVISEEEDFIVFKFIVKILPCFQVCIWKQNSCFSFSIGINSISHALYLHNHVNVLWKTKLVNKNYIITTEYISTLHSTCIY
jgi:hypothetical protein